MILPVCKCTFAQSLKAQRLERCKKMLGHLKNHRSILKIFSNKKSFTVDAILSYQKQLVHHVKRIFPTNNPTWVMVLDGMAFEGKKMPSFFYNLEYLLLSSELPPYFAMAQGQLHMKDSKTVQRCPRIL